MHDDDVERIHDQWTVAVVPNDYLTIIMLQGPRLVVRAQTHDSDARLRSVTSS